MKVIRNILGIILVPLMLVCAFIVLIGILLLYEDISDEAHDIIYEY